VSDAGGQALRGARRRATIGAVTPRKPLSYRAAGVDIDRGNRLARRIARIAEATHRPEVIAGVGGFASLFELPAGRYRRPLLVAGTDGVGTKLRLAIDSGRYRGIGIDLVAMCANDVATVGAEPLFFLDYYASARLDPAVVEAVIEGIGEGCRLAGAALVGGECAEMPGMYAAGDLDLAGFCVGVVEAEAVIDGRAAEAGDLLLGVASSGPHANGYSLIRKVLEVSGTSLDTPLAGRPLGDWLLAPTRIYVPALRALIARVAVRAAAHITGGGLPDNLPRVLPAGLGAVIERGAWEEPPIFGWLREQGRIEEDEMLRTFNCGLGMVVCVPPGEADEALACLAEHGERAWRIGSLEAAGTPGVRWR